MKYISRAFPASIILALCIFAILAPQAGATDAVVRLKNGNTLEGTIVSEDDREVMLDIPGAGKITFTRAEIASIALKTPAQDEPARAVTNLTEAAPIQDRQAEVEPVVAPTSSKNEPEWLGGVDAKQIRGVAPP